MKLMEEKKVLGKLVKNIRQDAVGVLICKDGHHNQYWKVLYDGDVVSWFENNIIEVEEDESTRRDFDKYISR